MIGYLISGAAAGIGGIVLASRLGAGIPAAAVNQELSLFGAVLIAGTSLWGGRANVVGSIVAILLLQIIYTGLVLSGYPERLQPILASILLIASVWYVQSDAGVSSRASACDGPTADPGPPTGGGAGGATTSDLPMSTCGERPSGAAPGPAIASLQEGPCPRRFGSRSSAPGRFSRPTTSRPSRAGTISSWSRPWAARPNGCGMSRSGSASPSSPTTSPRPWRSGPTR